MVCDATHDPAMRQLLLEASSLKSSQNTKGNILVSKVRKIISLMFKDIMSLQKPMVGDEIGIYNRQFIERWEKVFSKSFGKNGDNVANMDFKSIVGELEKINS
jgi:hypothetical protein